MSEIDARTRVLGIDVGTRTVKVALADMGGAGIRVLGRDESEPLEDCFTTGELQNMDAVSAAVRRAVEGAYRSAQTEFNQDTDRVVAGVAGIGATMENVRDTWPLYSKVVRPEEMRELLRSAEWARADEGKIMWHNILQKFHVDKTVVQNPLNLSGYKVGVDCCLVWGDKKMLQDTWRLVEQAGVVPTSIVHKGLVTAEAVANQHEKAAGCVVVDIGHETTSIVAYAGGSPIALTSIPMGSVYVTERIANVLGAAPGEEVEKKKTDFSWFGRSIDAAEGDDMSYLDANGEYAAVGAPALRAAIQEIMSVLFDQIRMVTLRCVFGFDGASAGRLALAPRLDRDMIVAHEPTQNDASALSVFDNLVLCGKMTEQKGLKEWASGRFFNASARLGLARVGALPDRDAARYASAMGICEYAFQDMRNETPIRLKLDQERLNPWGEQVEPPRRSFWARLKK